VSSPRPAGNFLLDHPSGKNSDFFHTQKGMKSAHKGMKTH